MRPSSNRHRIGLQSARRSQSTMNSRIVGRLNQQMQQVIPCPVGIKVTEQRDLAAR